MKFLHKYNGLCTRNIFMIKNVRTISLKKNVFVKLFETLFASDIFASYTDFQTQMNLVLF